MAFPGDALCEVMLRTCCSQRASPFLVGEGAKSSGDSLTRCGISATNSAIVASPPGRSRKMSSTTVVKALIDPTVSRVLSDLGLETPSDEQRAPEGVRVFHKNDIEKWWPIIKAANIRAE
jgi:hypothetical protein